MIRIFVIILPALIVPGKTEDCRLNSSEIVKLKNALNESMEYMKSQAINEDVALCMGTGRVGKSTLINYLIGNKLEAQRTPQGYILKRVDNNTDGPIIGIGTESTTKIPRKWISPNLSNLVIWDTPGFHDNRGVVQDITNAFYLHQLLLHAKSVKFIIVINYRDIVQDGVKMLTLLLENLEHFFGNNFQNFYSNIAVIISKAPYNDNDAEVNHEFINHHLRKNIVNTQKMVISPVARDFIRYIIRNKDHVAFFRRARHLGPVSSDIDYNIFPAINSIRSVKITSVKTFHPSISYVSELCLQYESGKLRPQTEIQFFLNYTLHLFENKISVLNNISNPDDKDKLYDLNKQLNSTKKLLNDFNLNKQANVGDKIEFLKKLDDRLKEKIESTDISQKVELISFIDYVIKSNITQEIEFSIDLVLTLFNDKLAQIISYTSMLLGNINMTEYRKQVNIMIEEYKKKINELRKKKERLEKSPFKRFLEDILESMILMNSHMY